MSSPFYWWVPSFFTTVVLSVLWNSRKWVKFRLKIHFIIHAAYLMIAAYNMTIIPKYVASNTKEETIGNKSISQFRNDHPYSDFQIIQKNIFCWAWTLTLLKCFHKHFSLTNWKRKTWLMQKIKIFTWCSKGLVLSHLTIGNTHTNRLAFTESQFEKPQK